MCHHAQFVRTLSVMRALNMSTEAELQFVFLDGGAVQAKTVHISAMIIAGWTGRDSRVVEQHIAELEAMGVPRPRSTPCFYRVSTDLLTTKKQIEVVGTDSSGEVEFFIIKLDDGMWVGVGSDHTDRKVESYNVTVSKQLCAKPIAPKLWRYDDLKDHWDQLSLRAYRYTGTSRHLHQEGPVTTMLAPEDLMASYTQDLSDLPLGAVMFCGTLAVVGGIQGAETFGIEIEDPVLKRVISHQYRVETLPNAG